MNLISLIILTSLWFNHPQITRSSLLPYDEYELKDRTENSRTLKSQQYYVSIYYSDTSTCNPTYMQVASLHESKPIKLFVFSLDIPTIVGENRWTVDEVIYFYPGLSGYLKCYELA